MSIAPQHEHRPSSASSAAQRLFDDELLHRIEELLALPADTAAWWTALAHRIDQLDAGFWNHRAAMEGPRGLFQDVLRDEPRLAFQVKVLERDLGDIATDIAQLRLLVSASMGTEGGVPRALAGATEATALIRAHHRRIRALIHEAYTIDLGYGG